MKFMLFDNVVKIGEPFTDQRGTVCVISNGNDAGIFWIATGDTAIEPGQYKNGFFLGSATYELSDKDAEEMLKNLCK